MGTLESVSAQQRQQRSSITPHQLNNNVNQNLPRTGTGDSRVRSNPRSSCNVGPYFALLMMASLFQTSVAAGSFEGGPGSNTPARPPAAAAAASESNHRNSNGGGGGGGERQQPPPGALSPAMYTRVSNKETDVRRAGPGGAETGSGGGAWGRERESYGGREGGRGGGGGVFDRDGGGDGHRDGRAGQRQQAFLAAGRTSGRAAALEQRAGAGADGGRAGGGQEEQQALFLQQQLQRRQEAEQMARGEPWDATATGYGTAAQGAEGAGSAEGVQGPVAAGAGAAPAPPASPANTPLQEQVYQTQYRHQHNQIPGQAIGTQQRSSSLFRRAGSGGVFFIFVILVCRSLNSYEHADQLDGMFRGVMMAPAVALFLGNLVCMCLSLVQSATTKQKARMKTMLTIDAAAEGVLLVYNLLCLLRGSGYIPREEFVSRMLGNVLFLSLCFTFAKARWVADGAY